MYKVNVMVSFAGAHHLDGYDGACRNLHGHNWKVRVQLTTNTTDELGMAIDFGIVKQHLKALIEMFDHKYLNELSWFKDKNPTSENIAKVIYEEMKKVLKSAETPPLPPLTEGGGIDDCALTEGSIKVSEVEIWESDTTSIIYSEL